MRSCWAMEPQTGSGSSLCYQVAALVKDELVNRAFVILDEGYLGVDHFQKEFDFGFGKELDLSLPGRLKHKASIVVGYREYCLRRKLIFRSEEHTSELQSRF